MFDIFVHIELQGLPKALDLLGCQDSVTSRREVQLEKPDFDPPQLFYQPPEILEHHTDLVLPALRNTNFIPWIHSGLDEFQFGGRRLAAMQWNSVPKYLFLLLS